MGKLDELMKKCGMSAEMVKHIISYYDHPEKLFCDIVCGAPVSLSEKLDIISDYLDLYPGEEEVSNVYIQIVAALNELRDEESFNNDTSMLYLFDEWYDTDVFIKKSCSDGMYCSLDDALSYIEKEDSYELEDYAEIRFMTRNEAEKILDQLINDAGKKGEVTVEDFITYTGFKGFINFGYKDLIWTLADTIKGKVYQEQSGKFFIDLPEPHRKEYEDDSMLFYDSVTGKFFRSTYPKVKKVIAELNEKFMKDNVVTASDYLEKLGFKHDPIYDKTGWSLEFPNFNISANAHGKTPDGEFFFRLAPDRDPSYLENNKDSVLSIWYDYLMCSDSHLAVSYNNGHEEEYHFHNYAVKGKTWKDQVFEIAKYLYTFIDEVLDDVYGEGQFTPDMISRNAIWMALDIVDHERQEIQYNMNDPEEFDRITDL